MLYSVCRLLVVPFLVSTLMVRTEEDSWWFLNEFVAPLASGFAASYVPRNINEMVINQSEERNGWTNKHLSDIVKLIGLYNTNCPVLKKHDSDYSDQIQAFK